VNKRQENETESKTTKKKTASNKATKPKANKKKVAKKSATKKKVTKKTETTRSTEKAVISPRERYEMIATMAYYRAEARNFEPGYDVQDWLDCESIIDDMLKNR
jgi:FtsZ-interacting cell division protein YlmF